MNIKTILIGGAAFVGALYFFNRSGPRANTAQPVRGASSYIGRPAIGYTSAAPVYLGATQPRQGSVTDTLFGNVIDLANSTRVFGGST